MKKKITIISIVFLALLSLYFFIGPYKYVHIPNDDVDILPVHYKWGQVSSAYPIFYKINRLTGSIYIVYADGSEEKLRSITITSTGDEIQGTSNSIASGIAKERPYPIKENDAQRKARIDAQLQSLITAANPSEDNKQRLRRLNAEAQRFAQSNNSKKGASAEPIYKKSIYKVENADGSVQFTEGPPKNDGSAVKVEKVE
jgi:hypothetical protein